MDIWDKDKRSAVMSKIRSKDTGPEKIVRGFLFARGYRYRKNVKGLPGTPDIVMRKYGIVIFIHGCFWHGHEHKHSPSANHEYWTQKIERNKRRDAENIKELERLGWRVAVVWECQLKAGIRERVLTDLESYIRNGR